MRRFIEDNRITLRAQWVENNPHMDSLNTYMDNWRVTLIRRTPEGKRRQMSTYFSQGQGYGGREPLVDAVLDCIGSDAGGYEFAETFEEWAGEYGYDPDSRKAYGIWQLVGNERSRLLNWLGGRELYERLLVAVGYGSDDEESNDD